MEWPILIIAWIGGLAWYFIKTTEPQRQMHLMFAWGFLLLGGVISVLLL